MRSIRLAAAVATLALAGCVAPSGEDLGEPDLDSGKADSAATPVLKGLLPVGATQDVVLDDRDGNPVQYVYFHVELSDAATLGVDAEPGDDGFVPAIYVYHPNGSTWGHSLVHGNTHVEAQLAGAGTYRVMVRRKLATGTPHVGVSGTCEGTGCTLPQIGCTPTTARTQPPTVFVGPTDWQQSIEAAIDSAAGTLDVQMYLFTVTDIAQHIIAAHQRGVAVRVLLDPHEDNSKVQKLLNAAGVPNKTDPTVFTYAHAKYMVIDGTSSVVLSGNFNTAAVDTASNSGERNYGFVDRDPDDAARMESVFESDWTSTSGAEPDLSCSRLIVSPVNSKQRILDHVNSAMKTLDIEVLYLEDTDIRAAIVAAATRGAAVRVMLSDPARNSQNLTAITYFKSHGIPVKALVTNYLHTKMIQADGIALVGSENMSVTSLTKNRELGGLVFEPAAAAVVHAQYEADWAAAVAQ